MRRLLAALTRVRILNLRDLAGHKLRVVTSLLVVVVSSALLVAVLGAYGSMSSSVRAFNAAISGKATVEVAGITDAGVDEAMVGELRRAIPEAKAVVPLVRGQVFLDGEPTVLLGADQYVTALSDELAAAAQRASDDGSVGVGDLRTGIIAGPGTGLSKGQEVEIGGERLTVIGVADGAGSLNRGRFVFAFWRLAQRLTGLDGRVDSILLVPAAPGDTPAMKEQARRLVDGRAVVLDPAFRVKQAEVASAVTRDSTLLVAMVSLVIAAFLVFNTMNMAIASRRSSLAMIRALGGRRIDLAADLLAESVVFGLVGGALGIPLGILAGRYAVGLLPSPGGPIGIAIDFALPAYAAPAAIGACVAACLLATLIAARAVFAVSPIEAMVPVEVADSELPRRVLSMLCGAAGIAVIGLSVWIARNLDGREAILAGLVYVPGGLLLCFALTGFFAKATVAASRVFGGPGQLAGMNSARAPRRVWATLMTVAVAVSAGIGISGSLSNMIDSVSSSLDGLGDPDLFVSSRDKDSVPLGPVLDPEIAPQVAAVPGVDRVIGGQWVSVNVGDARVLVQGIEPGSTAPFMRKASADAVRQTLDGDGILLSNVLARTLGVGVGDTLRLATTTGYHELVVRDLVNYVTIDSGTAAMSNQLLQEWFERPGDTYLQVFFRPDADAAAITAQVEAIAAAHPGAGGAPVRVYTGAAAMAATQETVRRAGAFATAIQWIVAGAAAIALLNTLLLSVLERRRELAVLRAMGASRRFIARMVLAEAAGIALAGGLVGVVLGVGLHVLSDRILAESTSIEIAYAPQWSAAGYVGVAVGLCLVGALVPALRASRMNIAESLVAQ